MPNSALIIHPDGVPMNADAHKLIDCSVDVLILRQSDQPDTEWNTPSYRLRNILSRVL